MVLEFSLKDVNPTGCNQTTSYKIICLLLFFAVIYYQRDKKNLKVFLFSFIKVLNYFKTLQK
jgi:hypothetical protein